MNGRTIVVVLFGISLLCTLADCACTILIHLRSNRARAAGSAHTGHSADVAKIYRTAYPESRALLWRGLFRTAALCSFFAMTIALLSVGINER